MTTSTVLARVRQYVIENFLYMRPDFPLDDDDRLLGRGVIDSMGVMELTEFLGAEFGIEVADTDITEANLGTLKTIARYVMAKRADRGAATLEGVGAD